MPRIKKIELWQVNLAPPVPRSDAIQSFVTQETPMLRVTCDDGSQGTGYSYTIGTALRPRPMHRDGVLHGIGRRLKIRRFDAQRWEISASAFR